MSETAMSELPRSWDLLARAAAQRGDREERIDLRELLCFELAGETHAIGVERVREIVRFRALTPMPRVPAEILGVISLRGEIVQILDLRRRLGAAPAVPNRSSRIIVLHGDAGEVTGLLVDAVREVIRVREEDFRSASGSETGFVSELCERGGRFISVLQLERVLDLGD